MHIKGAIQALQHASIATVLAFEDAVMFSALRTACMAEEVTETIMPQRFIQEYPPEFEPFC